MQQVIAKVKTVLCRNGRNCPWKSKRKKSNDNCEKCKVGLGEDDEGEREVTGRPHAATPLRRCCVASWLAQTLSFCPVANGCAHLASPAHAAIVQRLYELLCLRLYEHLFFLYRSRLRVCLRR